MSLCRCFPLLGVTSEAQRGSFHGKADLGMEGCMAGTKHPHCSRFPLGKTCWLYPENDPGKKITCCGNTTKGRSAAVPSSLLFLTFLQT